MDISDLNISDRLFAMLIGPTGVEKTTQAASFYEAFLDEDKYVFFFSFDGIEKLKIIKIRFPEAKNIKFAAYGPSDFHQFGGDFSRVSEDPRCAMMVIDSYTAFSITVITYQLHLKGQGMTLKNSISGIKTTSNKGGIVVPDWPEFNGEATIATELIDYCKGSQKHIIWIAHPVLRTDVQGEGGKQTGARKYRSIAAFGPKAADIIPGYFPEIYCLEVQQGMSSKDPTLNLAYTSPRNGFPGRTNFGLPDPIDFTNRTLYQVLRDELKKKGMSFMGK